MLFNLDFSVLAGVASLLNSLALVIAFAGAWLLLATRWRQQLGNCPRRFGGNRTSEGGQLGAAGTPRVDRFFYCFGFASLALAWLLSSLTRLM